MRTSKVLTVQAMSANSRGNRVVGWKAIGLSLGCTARTARRWEVSRGLPVHRIRGGGRGSVWAAPEELQWWLQSLPEAAQEDLRVEAEAETEAGPETAVEAAPEAGLDGAADAVLDAASAAPPRIVSFPDRRRRMFVAIALVLMVLLGVAAALQWRSHGSATRSAAMPGRSPYDDDPVALGIYKTARFELATRSADSLQAAAKGFKRLTDEYPERAEGWSGLADTYILLRQFGSMSEASAYAEADRAARVALALDTQLADAWLDRAFIDFWWLCNSKTAFAAFETALQLDPRSAKAYHWYATALLGHADFDRSLAAFAEARSLDPGDRSLVADEAWTMFAAGRRSEGIAALERLAQIEPDFIGAHSWLARAYLSVGRDADFLREAALAAKLRGQEKTGADLALAAERWHAGGRAALLEQLSAAAEEDWREGVGSAERVAEYRALAGDRAGMMRWLALAAQVHDHELMKLPADPCFDAYRSDPEFAALVARLR